MVRRLILSCMGTLPGGHVHNLFWSTPLSFLIRRCHRLVLKLVNDGRRELQVEIRDLQDQTRTRDIRIQPNSATDIELVRDAGGKRIEQFRVTTPYGYRSTREIVTEFEPAVRYELVVREWAMQSVAIDRTGKSPNVIEDINFQGRGIGRFFSTSRPLTSIGSHRSL